MAHAFISYVRDNSDLVDRLTLDLYKNGVDAWTDKRILPGRNWKNAIRKAIQDGVMFLACFSPETLSRKRTYMNEEITVAIEMLRQMPDDHGWFIPVRLMDCEIPARDIGAGHTLRDIQWVDLFFDWDAGVRNLVMAIRQALAYEEPLRPGYDVPRLPPLRNEPGPETRDAWKSVWSALFALKMAGEALFMKVDKQRLLHYQECLNEATRRVGDSAFLFGQDDFERLSRLITIGVRLGVIKGSIYRFSPEELIRKVKLNLEEFEEYCDAISEIRGKYTNETASSAQHLSARNEDRSQKRIESLAIKAEKSQREANVRRAAEMMVKSGKVSLGTECPKGHGKLREWDGMPRCWTCGWPWHLDTDLIP